jgi:hypothetical protein
MPVSSVDVFVVVFRDMSITAGHHTADARERVTLPRFGATGPDPFGDHFSDNLGNAFAFSSGLVAQVSVLPFLK